MTIPVPVRRWLAVGAGVALELGAGELKVVAVRVRPHGVRVLGWIAIEG